MPNVNGEQFCRFIKGNSLLRVSSAPVFRGRPEELKRICREAGQTALLPKDAVLAKVLAGALE